MISNHWLVSFSLWIQAIRLHKINPHNISVNFCFTVWSLVISEPIIVAVIFSFIDFNACKMQKGRKKKKSTCRFGIYSHQFERMLCDWHEGLKLQLQVLYTLWNGIVVEELGESNDKTTKLTRSLKMRFFFLLFDAPHFVRLSFSVCPFSCVNHYWFFIVHTYNKWLFILLKHHFGWQFVQLKRCQRWHSE